MLAAIACCSAQTTVATAAAPTSAAPGAVVAAGGAEGAPRYAYVLMHYEGTPKDDEYLLGLRVLIRSIQDTGTPHDIVVLLSSNVRDSTRATLAGDGALLHEVANLQNPFETKVEGRNSYKARFIYSFNKLYVWNMTQYTRVVFLDSDNIFLHNMDALFRCGHFCIVFMNPLLFHTGLIVVKPSTDMFNKLLRALYSDASFSHDGADQGFLIAQFDVEHAPLFLPGEFPPGTHSEAPAMRLNIGWNLNHFWYYIAFQWDWFLNAVPLEDTQYPWVQAYEAGGRRSDAVAGSSLAYCSGMMLKPWYWFPTFYFNHHYHWHEVRARLGIDYWPILLTRMLGLAAVMGLFHLANDRSRIDKLSWLEPVRGALLRVFCMAPVLFGYLYGVGAFFLHGYVVFQLIPYVTPPRMAWTVWAAWHVGLMWAHLNLLVNIVLRPTPAAMRKATHANVLAMGAEGEKAGAMLTPPSTAEEINAVAAAVTGPKALGLLILAQCLFFAAWLDIFPHFIVKIACFEYLLMAWIGLQAHVYRRATQAMCALMPKAKE